ncbi:molybdenum cofactor biosynthesis protein B [Alteriqipengyuania flavescens]|uniref:molybdenum cofactor biosynthesis protein B n=1 Tax=Alteriqipengyuania flavescens TaxID=3053610 RepID=UPI0025B2879F|nr:molybdenum cofactor biosynthesis protein B [Alteriqipengyuania flavescens]WJY26000.1 molybdenum cofactor biosynthesis protein B [Alteriqipengyuania flavescens]
MPGIDESREFQPLSIAVLTVSDTRTMETDTSGRYLADSLQEAGHSLAARMILPDDAPAIRAQVAEWAENEGVDIVLTTGGTGFAPRDVTPEAIRPILTKEMDGFSALFHAVSRETVGVSTMQSRALGGQVGSSFVFCLPGSTGACRDGWEKILKYELDSRYRPCSIVGMIPRFAKDHG